MKPGAFRFRRRREEERATPKRETPTAGLLWIAGGVSVTAFTYMAAGPGGTYLVAWGAILYGVIKLVSVSVDRAGGDDEMSYAERVRLGQDMTYRAMHYAAAGDAAALTQIHAIMWRMTERAIGDDESAELQAKIAEGDDAFLADLRAQRDTIPAAFRDIILDASTQVAPHAAARLDAIADALGLKREVPSPG